MCIRKWVYDTIQKTMQVHRQESVCRGPMYPVNMKQRSGGYTINSAVVMLWKHSEDKMQEYFFLYTCFAV